MSYHPSYSQQFPWSEGQNITGNGSGSITIQGKRGRLWRSLKKRKVYGKVYHDPFLNPVRIQIWCVANVTLKMNDITKKIIGMEIIKDMEQSNDAGGQKATFGSKVGKVYRCKLWMEDKRA
jgi:hypothetical protein